MTSFYPSVHSELPKAWEVETTFADNLYEWMSRAPWMAISAAAHMLVYFILAAIPWNAFIKEEAVELKAEIAQTPEEIVDDPPEELDPMIEERPIEDPVLQDDDVPVDTEVFEDPAETSEGDPDFLADANFDAMNFNEVIGIGPGAGGKFGDRFGGPGGRPRRGGSGTEQAVEDALDWLAAHQSKDGSWDADGFSENCGKLGAGTCEDPGASTHDVGLTGLALLAFLGDGHTLNHGAHRLLVSKGIRWLKEQQDPDTGLIGESTSHDFVYDHALATLALCEAYYFGNSPGLKGPAQRAISYIQRARDPYGAWRYDVPSLGASDTSITGWMIFALASAKEAGLEVDSAALAGGLDWIDSCTDPKSGLVGYTGPGELSSRTAANRAWPAEKGEAMTAVGLLCRIFLGQDPDTTELAGEKVMYRHAERLMQKLPEWDVEGFGCDMYYWYYGTYAMYQLGGSSWKTWNHAMKSAVLGSQEQSGDEKGSWDPVGPWGFSGGRVYSTALMTLCLEVYFRYGRVLGAR